MIYCDSDIPYEKPASRYKTFINFKNFNEDFQSDLNKIDWRDVHRSENNANSLKSIVLQFFDIHLK